MNPEFVDIEELNKCTCGHYHCPICHNQMDGVMCPVCGHEYHILPEE
jgi:hypothetical protein